MNNKNLRKIVPKPKALSIYKYLIYSNLFIDPFIALESALHNQGIITYHGTSMKIYVAAKCFLFAYLKLRVLSYALDPMFTDSMICHNALMQYFGNSFFPLYQRLYFLVEQVWFPFTKFNLLKSVYYQCALVVILKWFNPETPQFDRFSFTKKSKQY